MNKWINISSEDEEIELLENNLSVIFHLEQDIGSIDFISHPWVTGLVLLRLSIKTSQGFRLLY